MTGDKPLDPSPQSFWDMCRNLQALADSGQFDQLDIRVTFRAGRWVVRVDDGDTVTRGGGATLAEAYAAYTEDLP
jgi:hypothetical protein